MFRKLLSAETKTINSAAIILAVSSFISGLLGLLRDRLLACNFGAGNELDIYYAAFRIPDFVSMALIMGSIAAAVIPLFCEYLAKSEKDAWRFFANLLNSFLLLLAVLSAILIVFVPQILSVIAPGFSGEKLDQTAALTRIMFLSPIILGISNMISGVLRVFKKFVITSLSPILYNLGIILGIVFLVPIFGLAGLAWGVVLGALLHLLIQMPALIGAGWKFDRTLDLKHPGLLKTIKLTLPRTIGLAAAQVNLIVITAIGSTLVAGSIAVFNLANNLQNLPVTFIGNSLSTAAFPFLALYFSKNNRQKLAEEFASVFKNILLLILPVALLTFVLRAQIVRIILGSGRFSWGNTQLTAACLGLFSIGITAYALNLLISKTFYAFHNTRIPALAAILSIGVNAGLSFFFLWVFSFSNFFHDFIFSILDINGIDGNLVAGLPLALSLSGIFQLFLLLIWLKKEQSEIKFAGLAKFFLKTCFGGIFLVAVAVLSRDLISSFVNMQSFGGIFFQFAASCLAGFAVYISIGAALGLKKT